MRCRCFRSIGLLVGLAAATVASARADLMIRAPDDLPISASVTAEQLWQVFDHALPAGVWISPLEAPAYQIVPARWMRRTFLPALKEQMHGFWAQNLPMEDSAANCSGFALICRLMLNLSAMHARAHAPAVASVIVKQDHPFGGLSATRENHCVIFVLTDEGPWILEAQSGIYIAALQYPNRATIRLVSVH